MKNIKDLGVYFESLVRERFSFLEYERGMNFSGTKEVGEGDPRESGLVASYRKDRIKIDIGWSQVQISVIVLIHLADEGIPRGIRYLYLDSFIEFSSDGVEKGVVAQIYPRMSQAGILKAMRERSALFREITFPGVVDLLSESLRRHYDEVVSPSPGEVVKYHEWMNQKR